MCIQQIKGCAGILSGMPGFAGFIGVGEYSIAMMDKEGRTITFKVDGDCLNILINNFIVRITTGLIWCY